VSSNSSPAATLDQLRRLNESIPIGVIGVGSMGKGLLYQSRITPGIRCVAVADIDVPRAISVATEFGCVYRVVDDLDGLHDAVREGVIAIAEDGNLLARCELVDAIVESSSAIIPAAGFCVTALRHHKHLILMNAEVDLTFGPHLLELARANGVTYTTCDGDQHGVIKHLVDEIELWGFDVVMAGNIKGFLDRYTDPVKIVPEADIRNLSYRMATAYTDGTKLGIEMALLANAFGWRVTTPGMQGPPASDVREVFQLFDFESIRNSGPPVVDYILGAEPNGGVFVVGHCDNAYQMGMLKYYKMGDGPFYLFYRPYHLCHIEAMTCIADACLDGRSLLQPHFGFRTNVIAYAKKPLRAGETLDGLGGFSCYGLIENSAPGAACEGLPICLAEDVRLVRDVPKDGRIALRDVCNQAGCLDLEGHLASGAVRAR
jgi:predicted homoserine dehydrogenase-like protein